MTGLTALVVVQCALWGGGASSTYQSALTEAQTANRPFLVLVGAEWCPGCRTMKHQVLPGLVRRGALRDVSFAAVDADAEAETARQLMRGSSIPQLIVFSRKADGGWHREQITGATSEREVRSLIERALRAQQPSTDRTTTASTGAIGN